MKRLYVCGSFRFIHEMEVLERQLKEENIQFQISKKTDSRGILGCLKKVDDADVVYVVNPQGYIGKSVSVDIGYAYAKKKSIYAMHAIDDPPIMNLINDVLSPKALIDFLKENIPKRH
jgi:nucleoside 2-deoxyribosyltransferase